MLALYVILTGTIPTLIQAVGFGVAGGSGSEFAAAMVTGLAVDALMLLPVLVFANHRLGILHPLILAVLLWPLLTHLPLVIQDWGGWAGPLSGLPVEAPHFIGLPSRSASAIWTGIAKFNFLQIIALVSTYAGFWFLRRRTNLSRIQRPLPSAPFMRMIGTGTIAVSLLVLLVFLRLRGGINDHLTSLGAGRFNELEVTGFGPMVLIISFGAVALYVWAATSAAEIKRPLFLALMAAVSAAAFVSTGSRGGALEVPLMVGLIWALRRGKIPWKTALILLPFMFLAIGFLGAIRTSSWTGGTAAKTIQNSTWSEALQRTQEEVIARTESAGDVPVIVRGTELSGGPLLGKSYVAAVTAFIPRPIWPGKPRGIGSQYAQLFLGAKKTGTSIPISPEAEMYWNFGIPGVILLSIAYGALLRAAYQFLWRRYPDPFAIAFYLCFVTSFQFSSDRLVGLEQRVVFLVILYFVVTTLMPKRRLAYAWPTARAPRQPIPKLSVNRS
jgi:hypothetical protein